MTADDGVGVHAERLPHLFRKFSQLDGEERGREIGGSGLGLAICKGIVEAHGGRIRAESGGPGLGSRFTFTVPAVEEAVTLPPSPARGVPRLPASRLTRRPFCSSHMLPSQHPHPQAVAGNIATLDTVLHLSNLTIVIVK